MSRRAYRSLWISRIAVALVAPMMLSTSSVAWAYATRPKDLRELGGKESPAERPRLEVDMGAPAVTSEDVMIFRRLADIDAQHLRLQLDRNASATAKLTAAGVTVDQVVAADGAERKRLLIEVAGMTPREIGAFVTGTVAAPQIAWLESGPTAVISSALLAAQPTLFGEKPVEGGRTVNVERVIGALSQALEPEFDENMALRRETIESAAPVAEKYGFPNWEQKFEDADGQVWTFRQIVQGMLDNFLGRKSEWSWRLNDEVAVPEEIFPLSRPGLQVTGPSAIDMAMNQLNADLSVRMPDLEDAALAWEDIEGQVARAFEGIVNERELLSGAWDGRVYEVVKKGLKRAYTLLKPHAQRPVTIQRVAGDHLRDAHITVNGKPARQIVLSYVLHALNTYGALKKNGSGNYYYQPKKQTPEEALTVEKLLTRLEDVIGIQRGTIKIEALYEEGNAGRQLPAIMWVWRHRLIGTNVGRWDYLGSLIEMWHQQGVFPDPQGIGMAAPNMIAYQKYNALMMLMGGMKNGELSNAAPIGGMAAVMLYPKDDPYGRWKNNASALRQMKMDKLRERLLGLIFIPDETPAEGAAPVTLEDILAGRVAGKLYDTYRQSWVATTDKEYVDAGNLPLRALVSELQAMMDTPQEWTEIEGKRVAPTVSSGLIAPEKDTLKTLRLLNGEGKITPWVITKDEFSTPEKLFTQKLWDDLYGIPKGDITAEKIQHAFYMAAQYGYQILNGNYAAAIDDYVAGLRFMNDLATYRIFVGWLWTVFHHQAAVTKTGYFKAPELVADKGVIPSKNEVEILAGTKMTPELFEKLWGLHNEWTTMFFKSEDDRGAVSRFNRAEAPVIMDVLKRQLLSPRYLQHSPRVLFALVGKSPEQRAQILEAIFGAQRAEVVAKVRSGAWDAAALSAHDSVYDTASEEVAQAHWAKVDPTLGNQPGLAALHNVIKEGGAAGKQVYFVHGPQIAAETPGFFVDWLKASQGVADAKTTLVIYEPTDLKVIPVELTADERMRLQRAAEARVARRFAKMQEGPWGAALQDLDPSKIIVVTGTNIVEAAKQAEEKTGAKVTAAFVPLTEAKALHADATFAARAGNEQVDYVVTDHGATSSPLEFHSASAGLLKVAALQQAHRQTLAPSEPTIDPATGTFAHRERFASAAELYETVAPFVESYKDARHAPRLRVRADQKEAFRRHFADLAYDAVLHHDAAVREAAQWMVQELARSYGVYSASERDYYHAVGRQEVTKRTIPSMNIRVGGLMTARTAFRTAKKQHVGIIGFELAASEAGYTGRRYAGYAAEVLAAAVLEGYDAPVFLKMDHTQVNAKAYAKDPEAELKRLERVIDEGLAAGFRNVDIDGSTLEKKPTILTEADEPDADRRATRQRELDLDQQAENIKVSVRLTRHTRARARELQGDDNVTIGLEVGEVGKENTTAGQAKALLDSVKEALGDVAGGDGLSIQTGAAHGGQFDAEGRLLRDVPIAVQTHKAITAEIRTPAYDHMGGTIQHGASTLALELFNLFPEHDVLEVHLATELQNIALNHAALPEGLKRAIKTVGDRLYQADWEKAGKPEGAREQAKIRKDSIKKFIGEQGMTALFWNLPPEVEAEVSAALEQWMEQVFTRLNVTNTREIIADYTERDVDAPRTPPAALAQAMEHPATAVKVERVRVDDFEFLAAPVIRADKRMERTLGTYQLNVGG